MKVTHFVGAALLLAMLAAPDAMATARRAVIIGLSPANDCYRAVLGHRQDAGSLAKCDMALADDFLPREVRAATLVNRAVLHLRRHESRGALMDANQALAMQGALDQDHSAMAYFYRANANEDLGNARAAYADYRHAAELNPAWAAPRTELARFQVR
jgi:tetratricopeptide (TPR) repeat protein